MLLQILHTITCHIFKHIPTPSSSSSSSPPHFKHHILALFHSKIGLGNPKKAMKDTFNATLSENKLKNNQGDCLITIDLGQ